MLYKQIYKSSIYDGSKGDVNRLNGLNLDYEDSYMVSKYKISEYPKW